MISNLMTIALMATSAFALPSSSTPKPTCMEAGAKVEAWTVDNFNYTATYMSLAPGQLTHVKAFISFDLINPVLPYKAKCSALSESQPEPYADQTSYNCEIDRKYAGDAASFQYNLATGNLTIKQNWSCNKEGGRFETDGFVKVENFQCTDLTTTNNLWRKGSLYSTREVICPKIKIETPIKNRVAIL